MRALFIVDGAVVTDAREPALEDGDFARARWGVDVDGASVLVEELTQRGLDDRDLFQAHCAGLVVRTRTPRAASRMRVVDCGGSPVCITRMLPGLSLADLWPLLVAEGGGADERVAAGVVLAVVEAARAFEHPALPGARTNAARRPLDALAWLGVDGSIVVRPGARTRRDPRAGFEELAFMSARTLSAQGDVAHDVHAAGTLLHILLAGVHPWVSTAALLDATRPAGGAAKLRRFADELFRGVRQIPVHAVDVALLHLAVDATAADPDARPALDDFVRALSATAGEAGGKISDESSALLAGMIATVAPDVTRRGAALLDELAVVDRAHVPALAAAPFDLAPHRAWLDDVLPDGLGTPPPSPRASVPKQLP